MRVSHSIQIMPKYALTQFWKRFWKRQSSEYFLYNIIAQGHTTIWWVLIERYSEVYSESCQKSKIDCFRKIIITYYFRKTLHLKFLWGFWICFRISNMLGFWIFRVTQVLTIFINMRVFNVCHDAIIGKFWMWHSCICKSCICLNMVQQADKCLNIP